MREKHIPLFTLESQEPVKNFDFLGITLQYEMCYTNVLQVLDLSQIPLHAADRTEEDPIVIGGGPCAYNPEPLAPFFDLFYIGEGETVYFDLMDRFIENKKAGGSRKAFLEMAAQIPGIYVPAFYDVAYKADGTIASFTPNNPHAPERVSKELVKDMDSVGYIEKPLVPFIKATQDRVVLEIQRGCIRGCRFCQAGNIYRPLREHSLEYLKKYAVDMLTSTGHEEISLSSLSSSDYSHLEELVNFLIDTFHGKGVNISLPSLRIDAFSLDVMRKVQDVKKSSITFAPEAGSQRLRDVINKGLTEEVILKGARDAFAAGWNRVKLYFMLGQPTETREDMEGIALLSEKIAEAYYEIPKDQRKGKVQIVASSSFFVPKPFTPFQWARMCTKEEFIERANIVRSKFREMKNFKSLKYNWHEAELTVLEGVLARGDRRVAPVIEALTARLDVPVSVDTYKSRVAKAALSAGASLINDIWGFKADRNMAAVAAETGAACCLMHNRERADYQDFLKDMIADLWECVELARKAGVADDRIILDPGVGFGKNYHLNLQTIAHLDEVRRMGFPVLLGTSRKSVIGTALDLPTDQRLEGTLVTTVYGVQQGCAFLRVHDVKENKRAVQMTKAIMEWR